MKTANPFEEPTIGQVKALCSSVTKSITIPSKPLTEVWIRNPGALGSRLNLLCYRPAVIELGGFEQKMFRNLIYGEGRLTEGTFHNPLDIAIVNCSSPAGVSRARELAAEGITVVATVIEDDAKIFEGVENIFTYSGNKFSAPDLEYFVHGVLYRIRDRLYMGPSE